MYPKVLFLILFPLFAFSQSPQKINFQSILRNTNGEIVANKSVSLKISILSGSINGSSVYAETHTKTTDASGLISLQIGNGTVLSGVFANIGWGNASLFIKLEVDFNGGSNYVFLGTQELMSVPYALYASKTDTSSLNLVNRFSTKLNVTDTTSLSNRIDTKSSLSDTSLLNLANRFSSKLNGTDTSSLSNRIDTKSSLSDTSLLNLTSRFATKLNGTDTFSLSNRIDAKSSLSDTSLLNLTSRLSTKLNLTDTTSLSNRIDTKSSLSDTSLLNLTNRFSSKVNIADTANMLNPYLRIANAVKPINTSGIEGIYSLEFPEGLSKEIVFISSSNLPYTVPSGKNLYITTGSQFLTINGFIFGAQNSGCVLSQGTRIDDFPLDSPTGTEPGITGFLVEKSDRIQPVLVIFNNSQIYTVPSGKILVIRSNGGGNGRLCINNITNIQNPDGYMLLPEGTIIKNCSSSDFNYLGYLIDK